MFSSRQRAAGEQGRNDALVKILAQDIGGGKIEIAAIDPVASMQAIDNPKLREVAGEVRGKLETVVRRLSEADDRRPCD